jgi:alpha-tubulin suppressor-like RCC1 family protein
MDRCTIRNLTLGLLAPLAIQCSSSDDLESSNAFEPKQAKRHADLGNAQIDPSENQQPVSSIVLTEEAVIPTTEEAASSQMPALKLDALVISGLSFKEGQASELTIDGRDAQVLYEQAIDWEIAAPKAGTFVAISGKATLSPTTPKTTVRIQPIDDGLIEPPQTFKLTLKAGPNEFGLEVEIKVEDPFTPLASTLVAGQDHSCIIQAGAVHCTGGNATGEVGNNTDRSVSRFTPTAVLLDKATLIAAGLNTNCALRDNELYCWGSGANGETGLGSDLDEITAPSKALLEGPGISRIAVGRSHACAVKAGALYCWGDNANGQLGLSMDQARVLSPSMVPGLDEGVSWVATGNDFTCAVKSTKLYCFGNNVRGQLATGDTLSSSVPKLVQALTDPVATVYAGGFQACAVAKSKTYCWGDNTSAQLGIGSASNDPVSTPRAVSLSAPPAQIAIGLSHMCAAVKGELLCWGSNQFGQAGTGVVGNIYATPTAVPGIQGVQAIATGEAHSCVSKSDGVYCFGNGGGGRLGTGLTSNAVVPTKALGLPEPIRTQLSFQDLF